MNQTEEERTPQDLSVQVESPDLSTISRRDFLIRVGAAAVVVGAVTGAAIGKTAVNEIQVPKEGIKTDTGIFFPLYEIHPVGIKPEEIPSQLDGFFNEGFINYLGTNGKSDGLYRMSPNELLTINLVGPSQEFSIVKKLAEEKVKIIFGDVDAGSLEESHSKEIDRVSIATILCAGTELIDRIKDIFDKKHVKNSTSSSRRQFLKGALFSASAVIVLPAVSSAGISSISDHNEGGNRILTRLNGIVINGAPEQNVIFFRSLMMADKMLTVAENMKQQGKENPRIAFRIGAAHAGIEDFLKAGHEFCRWLITQYPNNFLKVVIDKNGGIDNFTSARMLTVPPTVSSKSELREGVLIENAPDSEIEAAYFRKPFTITDERITDTPLREALLAKLK